ncbi:hypothetical protein [Streptomyces sp. NPDC048295]|uniref:hypothetical protein n=1 Tax=Streptomyces sp. NPDC048295 TaxID=3154617 RepID=UPI0034175C52
MTSSYCASKAGVDSFTRVLRAEAARRRVGAGIAHINWTDTDMIRDADRFGCRVSLADACRRRRAGVPRGACGRPLGHCRATTTSVRVRVLADERGTTGAGSHAAVVTMLSRRELPRLAATERFEATGLLDAGGPGRPGRLPRQEQPEVRAGSKGCSSPRRNVLCIRARRSARSSCVVGSGHSPRLLVGEAHERYGRGRDATRSGRAALPGHRSVRIHRRTSGAGTAGGRSPRPVSGTYPQQAA